MRPDFGMIRRQQEQIHEFAGETALWRAYVSASAGASNVAGAGGGASFVTRTITALFASPSLKEQQVVGGQFLAGDMMATVRQHPGANDEIIWRGAVYHIEGEPIPESLQGIWRVHLRRGGATG